MKAQPIDRGVMTSDDVLSLITGKRQYGNPTMTATEIFDQPIPDGFIPLMDTLREQLQLQNLSATAKRSEVFNTYGHDITKIEQCRSDFQTFVHNAVHASVIRNTPIKIKGTVVSVDEYLQQHMPSMANEPLIDLSAEIAALPVAELLPHLVSEIENGVVKLFQIVSLWFDTLVTREFVGLLKVTSPDTGRYHYFRPEQTQRVIKESEKTTEDISFYPERPFGQRTQYEKHADGVLEITHHLERHDHDIVNMERHFVEEYPDAMPMRIVRFLEDVPEFIRPSLQIVSGMIVREQILRRTTGVQTDDVTLIKSVWLGSPAVTIAGVYAPIGWSSRDMEQEETGFFSQQKVCPPPPSKLTVNTGRVLSWAKEHWKRLLLIGGVSVAAAIAGVLTERWEPSFFIVAIPVIISYIFSEN